MKVTTGSAKGTILKCLDGLDTRPTSDKVKQALFNILQYMISPDYVLDLFAGTGAIGIECLSRGAKNAMFVDNSPHSIDIINYNLNKTHLAQKAKVIKADAVEFLKSIDQKFDFIFIDAPYVQMGMTKKCFEIIVGRELLNENGVLVMETEKELENCDIRKYGRIILNFYQNTIEIL